MAHLGHGHDGRRCPLSGVQRTSLLDSFLVSIIEGWLASLIASSKIFRT